MKESGRSKKFFIFLSWLFFSQILSGGLSALDLSQKLSEYVLRSWTKESGLPQNTITCLLQTSDGYIWIGTPAGLARFDGVSFKLFTKNNTPSLENDHILVLHEDNKKTLWIGTNGGGMYSFRRGTWKHFSRKTGLSNNFIQAITSDWQGNLWAGTQYGLNRLNSDGIKHFTKEDGLYDNIITSLFVDNLGSLWIGTLRGGAARLRDRIEIVYGYREGLQNMSVNAVTQDHRGNIRIGTLSGLFTLITGDEEIIRTPGTEYYPVSSIIKDTDNALWLGTMAMGLIRINKGRIEEYSTNDGFPDDYVRCILQDKQGTIWLGTDTRGLVQLKNRVVTNITRDQGIIGNVVTAIVQDGKGTIWAGSRNNGLCKIQSGLADRMFTRKHGLTSNSISTLSMGQSGEIWIGTAGAGINILRNSRISQLKSLDRLASEHITTIYNDLNGSIWIGTDKGLNRFKADNNKLQEINRLQNEYVRSVLKGRSGNLYVGTKSGLYILFKDSYKETEIISTEIDVISLYEDRHGTLWIGTNGEGLKRWHNGGLLSCTPDDGLPDKFILSITEDADDNMWFSSYKGVFKINRRQLNEFFEDHIDYISAFLIDEVEGMSSSHCSGKVFPAVSKSQKGILFYPTAKGISIIGPDKAAAGPEAPVPVIDDVRIGNKSFIYRNKNSIDVTGREISFIFTAFDYNAPNKISFRYKLEGKDSDFVFLSPGNERIVSYANLASGSYRFVVSAAGNGGMQSQEDVYFNFTLDMPFYKNILFQTTITLAILFSILLVLYQRRRRKISKRQNKYKTSGLAPERSKDMVPKLTSLLESQKLYLDPDLTLKDLSQKLHIHYNHLSQIINEHFGLSYNDYINKYRIDEAKQLLLSPEAESKNITEIMYECGFYSKSVFNTAFKKFTGLTPSEFKKKQS